MRTKSPDVISLKFELCCFLTSSLAKVFTKSVKKWLRQRVLSAGNGRSHSRQMQPNIGLGDEIHP